MGHVELLLEVALGSGTDATAPPMRLRLAVTVAGITVFARAGAPWQTEGVTSWDVALEIREVCGITGVAAEDVSTVALEIHLFDADTPECAFGSHRSTIGALLGERRRRLMLTGRARTLAASKTDALDHVASQRASLPAESARRPPSARRHFDFGRTADDKRSRAVKRVPDDTSKRGSSAPDEAGAEAGVEAGALIALSLSSNSQPSVAAQHLVPCGDSEATAAQLEQIAAPLPSAPSDATQVPRPSSTANGSPPGGVAEPSDTLPPPSHSHFGAAEHVQSEARASIASPPPPGVVPLRASRRSVSGDEAVRAVKRQQGSIASATGAVATSSMRLAGTSSPSLPVAPALLPDVSLPTPSADRARAPSLPAASALLPDVSLPTPGADRTRAPSLPAAPALLPDVSLPTPGADRTRAPRDAARAVVAPRVRSAVPRRRAATSLDTSTGLSDSLEATIDMHDIDRAYGTSLLAERMSTRASPALTVQAEASQTAGADRADVPAASSAGGTAAPLAAEDTPSSSMREPARLVRKGSYLHEVYPVEDGSSASAGGVAQTRNTAFVESHARAAAEAQAAEETRLAAMDADERAAHDEAEAAKALHLLRKDKMLTKTMKGYKSSARSKLLGGRRKKGRGGTVMRQEGLRPAKPPRGRVSTFDRGELQTHDKGSKQKTNSFLGLPDGSLLVSSPKVATLGPPRAMSTSTSPLASPRGARGPAPGPPKEARPPSVDGKLPPASARTRRAPPKTPHPSEAAKRSAAVGAATKSARTRRAPPKSPHPSGRPKPPPPRHSPPANAERAPRPKAPPPPSARGRVEASGDSALSGSGNDSDSEEGDVLGGERACRFLFNPLGRGEASGESASDSETEFSDPPGLRFRAVDDDGGGAPPGLDSPYGVECGPSGIKSGAPGLVTVPVTVTLELYLLHCRLTCDEQGTLGTREQQPQSAPAQEQARSAYSGERTALGGAVNPPGGGGDRRQPQTLDQSAAERGKPSSSQLSMESGPAAHNSRRSALPKVVRQRLSRQRSLHLHRDSDKYREAIRRPPREAPASTSASARADAGADVGAIPVGVVVREGEAATQRSPAWRSRASLLFAATLAKDDEPADALDNRPLSQVPPAGGAPRISQTMVPPRAPRLETKEPLRPRLLSALDEVSTSLHSNVAETAAASALSAVRDELRHARLLLREETAAKRDVENRLTEIMRAQQEPELLEQEQEQKQEQEQDLEPQLELEHGGRDHENALAFAGEQMLEPLPPMLSQPGKAHSEPELLSSLPSPSPLRRKDRRATRQRRASSVASGMRATVMTPAVRKRLKARRTSMAHADADFAMLLVEKAKSADSSGIAPGPVAAPPAPDPEYLNAVKEMARQRREEQRAAKFGKPHEAPRETSSDAPQSPRGRHPPSPLNGGADGAALPACLSPPAPPLRKPRREDTLPASVVGLSSPKRHEPRSTRREQRDRAHDTRVPADHARTLTLGQRVKELVRIDLRARRAEEAEEEHLRSQVRGLQRSVESLRKEYAAAQREARADPFPSWRAPTALHARSVAVRVRAVDSVPERSARNKERAARRAAQRTAKRAALDAALAHQRVVREVLERACWREWPIDRSTRAGRAVRGPATYWCNDVTGESAWAPPVLSQAAAEVWRAPRRRRAIAAEMECGAAALEAERAQRAAADHKLHASQTAELKQGIALSTLRQELHKLRTYHSGALTGRSAGAAESTRCVRVLELEAIVRQHRVHAALAIAAALRRAVARRGAPDLRAAFAHLAHMRQNWRSARAPRRRAPSECPWCRRAAWAVDWRAAQQLVDSTSSAVAHAARDRARASERTSTRATLRREAVHRGWKTTRSRTVAHVDPAFNAFVSFSAVLTASP